MTRHLPALLGWALPRGGPRRRRPPRALRGVCDDADRRDELVKALLESRATDLFLIGLWVSSTIINALATNWPATVAALGAAAGWGQVALLRTGARLKPNQVIVTASIEPSSDMRQAARAMTEIRAALLAAGYTSEQASRQIADMVAAQNGETS